MAESLSGNEHHVRFMQRAIDLSRQGFPAPNPHVGCVIAKEQTILGEGWHEYAGGPHAEVNALGAAEGRLEGATAYVTLEPCNHYGRTGPCSEALIRAGVKEVFIAVMDPNPRAAGGIEVLRSAGIVVHVGLLEQEAREANRKFLFAMAHKRPYVVAKVAISLDGRISLPSGESKWLTGPAARERGQRLRAECGAVLVGRKTVEADDPQLTVRTIPVHNQPARIVIDSDSILPLSSQIFSEEAPTIRYTRRCEQPFDRPIPLTALEATQDPTRSQVERDSIAVVRSIVTDLGNLGFTSLMVEGGQQTISNFLLADLVDEFQLFIAPKILGVGPSWVSATLVERLADLNTFQIASQDRIGEDSLLIIRRTRH